MMIASTAMKFGGGLKEAKGVQQQGDAVVQGSTAAANAELARGTAARQGSVLEALQLEQAAGQERASSQRGAIEQRRQARIAQSRAVALAAASGGSSTDATVVNILGDIGAEGEYRALTELFEGSERAHGLEFDAALRRRSGDIELTSSRRAAEMILAEGSARKRALNIQARSAKRSAFSNLLSSAPSLFERFGKLVPKTDSGGGGYSPPDPGAM